jgi:multidrug efflux pump
VDEEVLAEIMKSEHGDPREMTGFMGWYANTLTALAQRPTADHGRGAARGRRDRRLVRQTPHQSEFFLRQDPEFVNVYVKARGNLSPEAQDALVRQAETRIIGTKGVRAIYVRAGGYSSNGGPNSPPNDTVGGISVDFEDFETRKALGIRGNDIVDAIRKRVADIPGLQVEVRKPQGGPPVGKAIQVQLQSRDPIALGHAADLVKAKLASDPAADRAGGQPHLARHRVEPGRRP